MSVLLPAASAAVLVPPLLPRVWRRWLLSRAKHRSLAGHSRLAKRVARMIPGYSYDADRFFTADGAKSALAGRRRDGFLALAQSLQTRAPRSLALARELVSGLPDAEFTSRYRVPFQFSDYLRKHIALAGVFERSDGSWLTDLDGNRLLDLAGSYGVNVFGVEFYKSCIAEGSARAQALGPLLGVQHAVVADNVRRLREISGLDAVSFHMSGTEAVMQAVRVARYHTGKRRLVRFCGAYHGWWEDVQPGIGNPLPPRETLTLADCSERSLAALRTRRDVACVLVNPLQALHPNANAPGDSALVDSSRQAGFDKAAYADWLRRLRAVCSERGIVLIFDEVFVGFRLARGGAQEFFGVKADLVTYGKTLGGGLPLGVVCGRADLMRRYRPEAPADICFARGTFNAHPYVMNAMAVFLERLAQPEIATMYAAAETRWNDRCERFNTAMQAADLPVRAANLQSIWTLGYTQPSRYNWMLQFYLREAGLLLSWVGTGRLIFSLDFAEADFAEMLQRFTAATTRMRDDGWWDGPETSNRAIRRQLLGEMLRQRLSRWRR